MANLPVYCNVLCETESEALNIPRGDIRLTVCRDCGFIHNSAFEPNKIDYDGRYENSLHWSPTFQNYARDLAAYLVERHDLRKKRILEIACGQGDFLKLICELGDNTGLGFDPSFTTGDGRAHPRVTIVPELFDGQQNDRDADLICCRHALEHIADPRDFLRTVRSSIGQHSECIVFFEVPNALFTLRELGVWDILYEHCSYFTEASLARCFAEAGFSVEAVRTGYDGQFLWIEARPDGSGVPRDQRTKSGSNGLVDETSLFSSRFDEKLEKWKRRIRSFAANGERAVVWGCGSKGVTFLNMLAGESAEIEFVVDINPRKQGMYVAGTAQRIVAPAFLRENRPHHVVVMNPIYIDEIRTTVSELGIAPEFHTA
jgi:2-polyprenyl-3-methyl-5-hydroxy-6-metoxy-1,4-benzoquinol methylase